MVGKPDGIPVFVLAPGKSKAPDSAPKPPEGAAPPEGKAPPDGKEPPKPPDGWANPPVPVGVENEPVSDSVGALRISRPVIVGAGPGAPVTEGGVPEIDPDGFGPNHEPFAVPLG